jgi:lipoate-protein ligase A
MRRRVSALANAAPLTVIRETFPGRPLHDTAVSHALLRRVAQGEAPETLRLYVPDEVVLFSLLDARNPGFARAQAAAQELGCPSLLRLAGGHAALFHRKCLAFAWALPDHRAPDGIAARFADIAGIFQRALANLGVDARQGEVPGEYCPGEYSVNAGGCIKLMGVGQRVIRGAAHVGGVVVVGDSARLRELLVPVYAGLNLDFDPGTAGSVEDAVPGIEVEDVRRALLAEFSALRSLEAGTLEPSTLALAAELESWHDPNRAPSARLAGVTPLPGKTLNAGDPEIR